MNEIIRTIEEIKKLEEKREPEKILPYLSHPSFLVRERAAKAISKTGKHLREKIVEILENGFWYEKAATLEILGEWANEKDINLFVRFLNDKNSLIREKAALSLFSTIKRLPALPQDFNPNILKKVREIFLSVQKKEMADEILALYREFFNK